MCTPPLALFGRGPAHTPGAAHEGTCRGRTGASSRALQGRPGRSNSTHPVEQRVSGSLQLVCWGMHAWDRGTGGVCALTLRSARNTSLVAVQLPSMPPSGRACPEARALQQLTCPASALWRGLVVHSAAGMVDATNRRAGKRRRGAGDAMRRDRAAGADDDDDEGESVSGEEEAELPSLPVARYLPGPSSGGRGAKR